MIESVLYVLYGGGVMLHLVDIVKIYVIYGDRPPILYIYDQPT